MPKVSYLVLQPLQVFLTHPGYLSLLEAPEVQSLGLLEDPCLLEYLGDQIHQGNLVLLSVASPVKQMIS